MSVVVVVVLLRIIFPLLLSPCLFGLLLLVGRLNVPLHQLLIIHLTSFLSTFFALLIIIHYARVPLTS